jgi:hypothetical protein
MQVLSLLTGLPLFEIRAWERYKSKGSAAWDDREGPRKRMPKAVVQACLKLVSWAENGGVPSDALAGRTIGLLLLFNTRVTKSLTL